MKAMEEQQGKLSEAERQEIKRYADVVPGIRRVREDEGGVRCLFCPSMHFRRSKLRPKDLKYVFMMLYPVRCLRCSQRQYATFAIAGLSVPASVRHTRTPRPQETWKSWTSGSADDPSVLKAHPPSYTPFTTTKMGQVQQQAKRQTQKSKTKPSNDEEAIW